MLDGETWMLAQELPEGFPLVGGGIIQQRDDGTPQMPQQLAEKPADLLLPDVVEVEQIVEAQLMPPGAHRNPGNDGNLVPPPLAMTMEGSLALRGPGLDHGGNQQEARLVGKN